MRGRGEHVHRHYRQLFGVPVAPHGRKRPPISTQQPIEPSDRPAVRSPDPRLPAAETYWLIVVDDYGRELWRRESRGTNLRVLPWLGALGLVVVLALAVHGFGLRHKAADAEMLSAESAALQRQLSGLRGHLPTLKRVDERAQVSFTRIWSKSGLGELPRLLGPAPVDAAAVASGAVLANRSRIVDAARIAARGRQLQAELDSLIEYFHDASRLLSNTPSIRPTPTPKTSPFGRRSDPITGQRLMHKGIDFGGKTGDLIRAPANGVVIFTGRRGGYGQVVVLDHGYGLQTHFAHLNRYRVKPGQRVRRGQPIADMGTTGKSTGPHLHYEVRRLGRPLDPAAFLLD